MDKRKVEQMELTAIIILAIVFSFLAISALGFWRLNTDMQKQITETQQQIERAEAHQAELLRERDALQARVDELRQERDEVLQRLDVWLDKWQVKEVEITGYAPLCDKAIAGWDYAGDPNITASGAQVVIGETVAAGPSVPFGARVWVSGHGWRVVTDRGSRITDRHLDIAVWSKSEAMAIGRQDGVLAVIEK